MEAFGSLPHLKVARGNFKLMRSLMVLNDSGPAKLSLSRMNPKFDTGGTHCPAVILKADHDASVPPRIA